MAVEPKNAAKPQDNAATSSPAAPSPAGDADAARGEFLPARGERALIIGQTGSGKTTAARWILSRTENSPIVVYDTKEEPKFEALPNSAVATNTGRLFDLVDDQSVDHIIYRPSISDLSSPETLDALLMQHYAYLRGVDCYIDELYQFHNAGRAGPGLTALYTRGRSRGITTIASTQRPAWVSRFAMSEAQMFYIFRLNAKEDRKRVCDASGMPEYRNPDKHWFYIYRPGDDEARLIRPLPVETGEQLAYVDTAPQSDDDDTPQASDELPHIWI